ncbi:MAG: SPOR domain-containing protein [Betaproteobacteria bacterium]|nr:SPOR domain-containing protein [Betaproteobacteria bacterium]
MRLLFLLLLAANLGFFAWMRFLAPADPAVDRQPLTRELEPQKLRIVAARELARGPAAPPAKPRPAVSPPEPAPLACLEWGSFSPADASRAAQRLEPLALGPRLAQYRGEETASWWVHMPSQGSRAAASRKAGELKKLEIDDYFILQDAGPMRWALSLGVFSTEDAAKAHLQALRAKGVRTAVIGRRDTRVPKLWFQVRDVESSLRARLQGIARDFEGATLHECAQRG